MRRTAREGQAFRLELVEAARALFAEDGFDAVSIRKITERAGCSPMTFYVYFRNKRELLRHIWEDMLTIADTHAADAAERAGDIPGRLAILAGAWTEHWIANPDSFRIVFLNQDRLASEDDIYFARSSRARLFTIFVELIERGVADGTFRKIDPVMAAQALLTSSIGLAYSLIMVPEAGWRKELIPTTIETLVKGLESHAAERAG
ncbi:MAG: TetR/AcrR family transcriptional regulator [Sphingopyxis sp.]|nr:TetR/AcrR family transcriptional regulator [Sphingopyxis sp.]